MKKFFTLLSLLIVMGMSANVMAQGTAIAPEVGAEFTYTVTPTSGNSYSWTLTKGETYATATDASADVTVVNASDDAYVFGDSESNLNSIKITWDSPAISLTDYYYLTITETGDNDCQNVKSLAIQPVNSFELAFVTTVDAETDNAAATNYPVCSSDASVVSFEGDAADVASAKEFIYDYGTTTMTYHIIATGITNTAWTADINPTLPAEYSGRVTATYGSYADATAGTGTALNGGSVLVDGTTYQVSVSAGTNDVYVTFVVDNTLDSENTLSSMGLEGTAGYAFSLILENTSSAGGGSYVVTEINDAAGDATESHTIKARPATAITTP